MQTSQSNSPEYIHCAENIISHLEKNMMNHRNDPQVTHKMATMKKYIYVEYVLGSKQVPQETNRINFFPLLPLAC
jgi:hypothetical protein